MNREDIDAAADDLRRKIWRSYKGVINVPIVDPVWLLRPATAAQILGYTYLEVDQLGTYEDRRDHFEVAGLIDQETKSIQISMRFTPEVMRFTGAHEIGHALMHPGERKHRDRPVSDHVRAGYVKSKSEKEADYFAASYLIPGKLLQSRISDKFGKSDQIIIDDNMAHFLSPNDPQAFLESDISTCAAAIATVERFGGVRSLSLASQFGVSVRAMSIRLQELNMVTF